MTTINSPLQIQFRPTLPIIILIGIIAIAYFAPDRPQLQLFVWPLFWWFLALGPTSWIEHAIDNMHIPSGDPYTIINGIVQVAKIAFVVFGVATFSGAISQLPSIPPA